MRSSKKRPGEYDAPLTLSDLTKARGLVRAAKALNASPNDMVRINQVARSYLKEDPSLSTLVIGKSTGSDFYDIKKDRVAISSSDPDILSHEIGHAVRLRNSSNTYKNVLTGAKALNKFLAKGALPVGGAVSYSKAVSDKNRGTILTGLAAASVLSAIPNLTEEVMASTRALKNSTNKLQTLAKLAPGLSSHALHELGGAGTYALYKTLKEKKE